MSQENDFRFDFAISFSGNQREIAENLRDSLCEAGFKVFYDRDFEYEMFGRDGSLYLRNVYSRESRFCIVLISKDYDLRGWTNLERESIQAREIKGEHDVLLPVLVDGYRPDWLPPTRIFFDLTTRSIKDLILLLTNKIAYKIPKLSEEQLKLSCFSDYRTFTQRKWENDERWGSDLYCSTKLCLSDDEIIERIKWIQQVKHCRFCNTILTSIRNKQYKYPSADPLRLNWKNQGLLVCEQCGWWIGQFDWSLYDSWEQSGRSYCEEETYSAMEAVKKTFSISDIDAPVAELRGYLQKNPRNIRYLHPNKFAEVFQDIFCDIYDCEVRPVCGPDGNGNDLYLIDSEIVHLVQVKRHVKSGYIESVASVRELIGSLIIYQKRKGCLITTADRFDESAAAIMQLDTLKESHVEIDLKTMADLNKMLKIANSRLPELWERVFENQ